MQTHQRSSSCSLRPSRIATPHAAALSRSSDAAQACAALLLTQRTSKGRGPRPSQWMSHMRYSTFSRSRTCAGHQVDSAVSFVGTLNYRPLSPGAALAQKAYKQGLLKKLALTSFSAHKLTLYWTRRIVHEEEDP